MKKEELKKLILTAGGARKADTVIKNCKVVNVFSGKIVEGVSPFAAIRSQESESMRVK